MITFEKQNNIEVAAIDVPDFLLECKQCIFERASIECRKAKCYSCEREDGRDVFFLSVYDKRILDYKAK